MREVISLRRRGVRKSSISAGADSKSIAACWLPLETDKREGLPAYFRTCSFSPHQFRPELDLTSHCLRIGQFAESGIAHVRSSRSRKSLNRDATGLREPGAPRIERPAWPNN